MASPLFWALPEGVEVRLIETDEQLEAASGLLGAAVCCGIDAEWPPEETAQEARSGGPPHATLVQLALWLPAGAVPAATAAAACCVLLLDMLRLPQAAAKQALQALFRNRACLKLGFGLVHDLRAIAAALGPQEGGSCIAVVEPACDLGSIHRFLRHRRAPGVHKAVDLGLSGLVEAQLGVPLDKQQQCSAWGERPLSREQRRYAAADAACLLGLLGSLVGGVRTPEEWPMGEGAAGGGQGAGAAEEDPAEAAAAAGAEEEAGAAAATDAAGHAAVGTAEEQQHRQQQLSLEEGQQQEAQRAGEERQRQQQHPPPLLGGCSPAQLRAAAAAWGGRLEISGSRAVRRSSSRLGRRRQQRGAGGGGAGGLPPGCSGFPLHVPWMDAGKRLTGTPRFLCDVMVEGLARQLRLCGFDAESLQASMERSPRHAVWRCMVERGEGEGRVVLTRDRTFIGASYSDQAFLVRADTKREQLEEVLAAFGLAVTSGDLLTRCARCNGEFFSEPVPAARLPAGHDVPPGILAQHPEFWVCARCSGVFWQGNQYSRAMQQMHELIGKMQKATLQAAGQ